MQMITEEVKNTLIRADNSLAALIGICGDIDIPLKEEYFSSLVSSIIGQQLSGRVAEVIWGRLVSFLDNEVSAAGVMTADTEDLRKLGISYPKISYIKNIAAAVLDNSLDINNLQDYSDEEIIAQLTRIRGIGRWTAEMFLIFSLGREDVFAMGDGGLLRAVRNIYGFDKDPTKAELSQISARWAPYRTAASLYLWRSLDKDIVSILCGKKQK